MEYITVNDYLKNIYGEKVYKLAIDGGFTCPNRDGTIGTGGCIFCSAEGSGDFAEDRCLSVTEQIERGKIRVEKKMTGSKYIAYFQAFTNTYAPVEVLRKKYEEAISCPEVVILSIATRPDCLSDEVIELLSEINRKKTVWVELGLQTIHEDTAKYMRRGYPLSVYDAAVKRLKAIGVHVITHVILGLPGEGRAKMLETVRYVGESGSDGIKLQLLHVLRGTDLASEYEAGKFETLSLEEYVQLVCDSIRLLPKEMVIHRMTGDGDRRKLIAPLWSLDKKRVLNALTKALREAER